MDNLRVKINDAWKQRRCDEVLLLLKEDSYFPNNFKLDYLVEDGGSQSALKGFVQERIELHELIQNGDLEGVKKKTCGSNSKFFLHHNGHSAAYTAIVKKHFHIYAYLNSFGVHVDKSTKNLICNLNLSEKHRLDEVIRMFLPSNPILDLRSKSTSFNQEKNFDAKAKYYYTRLYEKIPEILNVVQYENDLEIIFDCNDDDVISLCPLTRAYGVTFPTEKRIYIASKREESETLGTLAHELTHLAMNMVFENEGKPYVKSDENEENIFSGIKNSVWREISDDGVVHSKANIIARVFYYCRNHEAELIVRIPHILVSFENDGEQWLERNVRNLFDFYQTKVKTKCAEFASQGFLLKPRNTIRKFNENHGEMKYLKNDSIFFQNVDSLKKFLEKQKISFIVTKNLRLGLLRVLQALYQKSYFHSYNNFIAFKLQNWSDIISDFSCIFASKATHSLILNCGSINNILLKTAISKIISLGSDKIIIFIVEPNQVETIQSLNYEITKEEDFSLNDLDQSSRNLVLEKPIHFQGTKTTLSRFCGNGIDFNRITSDVIEKLLTNANIEIGTKLFGISSLEGSYAHIIQKINTKSLVDEMQNSSDIYIIFAEKENIKGKLKIGAIAHRISDFDPSKFVDDHKNIFFAKEELHENFKKFCGNNSLKKIYLISNKDEELILDEIYNPDFYLERKIRKIVVASAKLEAMIYINRNANFIISGNNNIAKELRKKYLNITPVDSDQAKKLLSEKPPEWPQDIPLEAHWFHAEKNLLIWKDSYGSVKSIRGFIDEDLCKLNLMNEADLIKEIEDKKIVVIADEPGMGKSTILTKLYEPIHISNNHWIIRINLKDNLNVIQKIKSGNLTLMNVIHILQLFESKSISKLNEFFMELILNPEKIFSKSLLLALDGFDELLDEDDRKKIIELVKFLIAETRCKIWITSRLHYKIFLEDQLDTFALQLDPIDDEMKKRFIKKYYRDRVRLILSENEFQELSGDDQLQEGTKLWNYINQLIQKMKYIFQEDTFKILGTPLQLNLLLDNSIQYFKTSMEREIGPLNFSYLGDGLFEVYEMYVNRKYDVYFKKKNIDEEQLQIFLKSGLEKCHKKLMTLFIDNKSSEREIEKYQALLLLIGLVQLQGQNLQFFHITFREFYSAQILVEYITGKMYEPSEVIQTVEKLLKEALVNPQWQYKLVRKFIDGLIKKEKVKKIPEKILELIGLKSLQNLSAKISAATYLHINILECNSNIFKLLFSNLKCHYKPSQYLDLMSLTNELGYTLLQSAAVGGSSRILEVLFETMGEMSKKNQKTIISIRNGSFDTMLHIAASKSHLKIVKQLWRKIEEILSPEEHPGFFMSKNKNKETILSLAITQNYPEVVGFILSECDKVLSLEDKKVFLVARNKRQDNALLLAVARNNFEIIKLVLEKVEVLNDRDFFMAFNEQQENFLLVAVKKSTTKIIQLLLNKVREVSLFSNFQPNFFTLRNFQHENSLLLAVRRNDAEMLKFILRETQNVISHNSLNFKLFLMKQNNEKENGLFLSIRHNNIEIMEVLLKKSEEILPLEHRIRFFTQKNDYENTILSVAIKQKNLRLINFILKKAEQFLPFEDQKKFILALNLREENILMLAIELNNFEIINLILEKLLSLEEASKIFLAQNKNKENILSLAVIQGDLTIIQFLLKKAKEKLSPEKRREFFKAESADKSNVLFLAFVQNKPEIIKLILEKAEEELSQENGELQNFFMALNDEGENILLQAVTKHNSQMIKYLLERAKSVLSDKDQKNFFSAQNHRNENVLFLAIRQHSCEVVNILLDEAKTLLPVGESSKFHMAENKYKENVFLLALIQEEKGPELIKLLLKKGKNLLSIKERKNLFLAKNNNQENLFLLAIKLNNDEIINLIWQEAKHLLQKELPEMFLAQNEQKMNALFLAVMQSNSQTLKFLLEVDEFLSSEQQIMFFRQQDILKQSILFRAVRQNDAELITILFNKTEKILSLNKQKEFFMEQNEQKENILSSAIALNNLGKIQVILEKAKKLLSDEELLNFFTPQNVQNENILFLAVKNCDFEIIEFLIEKTEEFLSYEKFRSFFTEKNGEKESILLFAVKENKTEVIKLLTEKAEAILPYEERRNFFMAENDKNENVLSLALKRNNLDLDELLLKKSGKTFFLEELRRLFHTTPEVNKSETLRFLLEEAEKIL